MDRLRDYILSEVKSERERQILYITDWQNLKKNDTNEFIYKTETDSQTQRTNLWLLTGSGSWRGLDGEFGVSRFKLLYIEWRNSKVLL